MEMEQWLEDAMVIVNKWFCLMPSRVFRECLKSLREGHGSLVSLARAGNELGLVSEAKFLVLKANIPEPLTIRPSREELRALKDTHQSGLEAARFLVNYSISASRDMLVTVNLHGLDERSTQDFHRVIRALTWQAATSDRQEE